MSDDDDLVGDLNLPINPNTCGSVTLAQVELFLEELARTHHITNSAAKAGLDRSWVYWQKSRDDEFRERYEAALGTIPDAVQDKALELGLIGRPVYVLSKTLDTATGNIIETNVLSHYEIDVPIFRDLMKKYMAIPTGGNVTVGVQVNNEAPPQIRTPEDRSNALARLEKLMTARRTVVDAQVVDDGSDLL
jgi:hypothetical protein